MRQAAISTLQRESGRTLGASEWDYEAPADAEVATATGTAQPLAEGQTEVRQRDARYRVAAGRILSGRRVFTNSA